ncbi:MAG TPA: hypothetical protein GXX29_09230 [Firmicutes bacterium]|nr:hypothetical protein [Bacillota bacterium]
MSLKELVKNYAYQLGADLVGFGGIERCKHAPLMMSPQGLFPATKTIIVMGIHHPDACVELGGEKHPQIQGPYTVQGLMNHRLDEMSYRMATFLEEKGFGAVPIVSSNIWRYRQYKELQAVFAPDVSHIYMSVVAGLTEIGFSGIALSPEFGPRNRFVTVLTDAEIPEDPLIPPGTICDKCLLCQKHCPTLALSKEIDGENVLKIDPYEYRFPRKNLWRCAWGEHFDLDVGMELPDKVDEEVILEAFKKHNLRGGEMGQCLKFCLPPAIRTFQKSYSSSPVRRLPATLNEAIAPRSLVDRLLAKAFAKGATDMIVFSAEELAAFGLSLEEDLPGAKSAVTVIYSASAASGGPAEIGQLHFGANYLIDSICFDITRGLEELGFKSVMTMQRSLTEKILATQLKEGSLAGRKVVSANTVITRMTFAPHRRGTIAMPSPAGEEKDAANPTSGNQADPAGIAASVQKLAEELGADLFGIASTTRFKVLAEQLRPVFDNDESFAAIDKAPRNRPWDPDVRPEMRIVKTPEDYMPEAKSVIVFGLRLHREVVHWAVRSPAETIGPYAFQTYITNWLGQSIGARLIQHLESLGYKAVMVQDLMNTASFAASPRGPQPDLRSNRFAALCAGLGRMAVNGFVVTPQFGIRQRFLAIITDAPLAPSSLPYPDQEEDLRCASCPDRPCITTCPVQALSDEVVTLELEGRQFSFHRIDRKKCDWAKRYALVGESGFKYMGSNVDIPPGEEVTAESLAAALRQHQLTEKRRPIVAEPCVINCPYGNYAL